MTGEELSMLQKLPLDLKILKTKQRIREYYNHFAGNVYVSFSGGKDSTVLLDIVRQEFPQVKAVYVDTGLEFPEIKQFVKTIDNVEILRPEMSFKQVIEQYGYPVISKEIAYTIYYARKGSQWAIDRLNGKHRYGNHKKYKFLLNADFKIASICCDIMKKRPVKKFEKQTGLHPIVGTMADEGGQRKSAYLRNGCNSFNGTRPMSTPLGFWKEEDIWDYIHKFKLLYFNILLLRNLVHVLILAYLCNNHKSEDEFVSLIESDLVLFQDEHQTYKTYNLYGHSHSHKQNSIKV